MLLQEIKQGIVDSVSDVKVVASMATLNVLPQFDWGIFPEKLDVLGRFLFGIFSFMISFIYLLYNVWKRNSERKKIDAESKKTDQETEAIRLQNIKNKMELEAAHMRNMAEAEEIRAQNAILSKIASLEHVKSLEEAKELLADMQNEVLNK